MAVWVSRTTIVWSCCNTDIISPRWWSPNGSHTMARWNCGEISILDIAIFVVCLPNLPSGYHYGEPIWQWAMSWVGCSCYLTCLRGWIRTNQEGEVLSTREQSPVTYGVQSCDQMMKMNFPLFFMKEPIPSYPNLISQSTSCPDHSHIPIFYLRFPVQVT